MEPAPALERTADRLAPDVAELLEAIDSCADARHLRAALKVIVAAVPDLLISADPAPAVLSTTRDALEGRWP